MRPKNREHYVRIIGYWFKDQILNSVGKDFGKWAAHYHPIFLGVPSSYAAHTHGIEERNWKRNCLVEEHVCLDTDFNLQHVNPNMCDIQERGILVENVRVWRVFLMTGKGKKSLMFGNVKRESSWWERTCDLGMGIEVEIKTFSIQQCIFLGSWSQYSPTGLTLRGYTKRFFKLPKHIPQSICRFD